MILENKTTDTIFVEGKCEGRGIETPFYALESGNIDVYDDNFVYHIYSSKGACFVEDGRLLSGGVRFRNFGNLIVSEGVGKTRDGSLHLVVRVVREENI